MAKSKVKNRIPMNLFFFGTLIFGFIMASVLTHIMMRDSNDRAIQLAESRYTGLAFRLMGAYPEIDDALLQGYREGLRGLTIYDEQEQTVFQYGTIQEDPRIYLHDRAGVIRTRNEADLFIINISPELLVRREIHDYNERRYLRESFAFDEKKVFIHMEVHDPYLFRIMRRNRSYQILIQVFLLVFVLLIILSYSKANGLRQQLDEQKNLVVLGTAMRTLTHEMKNPLSIIQLQSLYLKKKHPGGGVDEEADVILGEVHRLTSLMDTVRGFLTKPQGEPAVIGLREFFSRQSYPGGVAVDLPCEEVFISFDPERFRSVTDNLVNNALESGSPVSEIRLSVCPTPRKVLICVEDGGRGIPEEIKGKVFDPFFTTKTKGTGAGLMIVRKLLEDHGSTLKIDSEEGAGTKVWFLLPRTESKE